MPIRFKREKGIYLSEQEIIHPSVYFDTWVYRKLINDEKNRKKIAGLFSDKFGTVCLSDTNIVEIVSWGEKEICKIAEVIYCMPFIIFEDNPLNTSIFKSLDIYYEFKKMGCFESPQEFKKLLLVLKDDTSGALKRASDDFIKWFNFIRNNETERNKKIEEYIRLKNKTNPTSIEVSYSWVGYLCNKKDMNINDHDIHDFEHFCKSIVYCDVVTMDRRWKAYFKETFPDLCTKIITDKGNSGINLLIKKIEEF